MTASDSAATSSGPDHPEGRAEQTAKTADGAYYSAQCWKCGRDITRKLDGYWTHVHNNAERCAPGTRNASLAESIGRSEKLHRR